MAIQHPREDEVRERHRVFGRLPHRVGEVEAVKSLVQTAAEWVQEEDAAQLGSSGPERFEALI